MSNTNRRPDNPSLEQLLEHEAWVRRLARRLVEREDEADDVVQQTWLNALLWPPRELRNLRAWLATVVRNAARQRRAADARSPSTGLADDGEAPHVEAVVERLEIQTRVTGIVLALRQREREVIVLRYYDGLSPGEIARRLDVPVATIKTRLARARGRLRLRLSSLWKDQWPRLLLVAAFGPEAGRTIDAGTPSQAPGLRSGWLGPLAGLLATSATIVLTWQLTASEEPPVRPPVSRAPSRPPPTAPRESFLPPPASPVGSVAPAAQRLDIPRVARPEATTPPSDDSPENDEGETRDDAAMPPLVVEGLIRFSGEIPEPVAIDLSADPACGLAHPEGLTAQPIRTDDAGGLADVFVVIDVLTEDQQAAFQEVIDERAREHPYSRGTPSVTLDQQRCTYQPSIVGLRVWQTLRVLNSDDTLHATHLQAQANPQVNKGLPTRGQSFEVSFPRPEWAMPVSCGIHPWMGATVFVTGHPWFAVTGTDGRLAIDGSKLPDGEYPFRTWHKTLGEQSGRVRVSRGRGRLDLTYEQ